ncbi:dihydrodipicolinate synthase family protein [Litorilinea aerophila]|uniref:N-acetylneuraminate lyase n=1 Tax=Litorilinea aerophila TaxID=1204385 RepID=A0A540VK96_9CHLR|nr:dihydrodipicolinate synthase family protein [Litorilinea aerophila]MCC9075217.1 dihydrodipicolinate synthase family protein [Litorilinea aerophila]
MPQFQGAWPALLTPFTARDEVNIPVLRAVIDYLLGKGIGGFYVCGSTGEGVYMSVAERQRVAETVVEQVNGRVPVIVHVGALALPDAVALASHAQAIGADAVASIIPPFYNDVASIVDYFAALSAAAPDLPLLSYIFGGPTDAVALMRQLMAIPTVAGSKYTGPNMHEFRQIVELGAEYRGDHPWTVFSGMDEECLFASMFGASGNIGSTLNYIPGVYREIHACREQGDLARATELQLQANQVTRVLFSFGFMGALKAVMAILGFDCGQPRLPNRPFPAERRAALHAQLEAVGFAALAAM